MWHSYPTAKNIIGFQVSQTFNYEDLKVKMSAYLVIGIKLANSR